MMFEEIRQYYIDKFVIIMGAELDKDLYKIGNVYDVVEKTEFAKPNILLRVQLKRRTIDVWASNVRVIQTEVGPNNE